MTSPNYCLSLVRQADHERYSALLYAPQQHRDAMAALYAFNVEIARIKDTINEPLAGEIRLRWWRDAVTQTSDEANANPVIAQLQQAIKKYNLPVETFANYCDARIFDLYNDPMPSTHDLEGYCGETASALTQLVCIILDSQQAPLHAEAAAFGGVAQALCGILRLLPIHMARGQLYIPADILAAVGAPAAILSGKTADPSAQIRVLEAMLALLKQHYQQFLSRSQDIPTSLRSAFLPIALVPDYIKLFERKQENAFTQILQISPLKRQWRMLKTAMNGRFPKITI